MMQVSADEEEEKSASPSQQELSAKTTVLPTTTSLPMEMDPMTMTAKRTDKEGSVSSNTVDEAADEVLHTQPAQTKSVVVSPDATLSAGQQASPKQTDAWTNMMMQVSADGEMEPV